MSRKDSLDLFHRAVAKIPAYRSFLAAHDFDPASVKTEADFTVIPVITKKNYLQAAERKDLLWPEALQAPLWFCSTSGSTGEPYYFPRDDALASRGAAFAEAFLQYSSRGPGRTLVLMAFGMGVWIGGIITLRSFEIAAAKLQTPVAFLPTGYNKEQIFKALKQLAPEFDQTILVGYPPFVKEIIDEAPDQDIDMSKLNMRLMFAAEAFTETFRNYVVDKAGVNSSLLDTLNIYGSADIGAMGYETPLSILIRQLALEDPLLYKDMFGQIEKTPTLAQYHPEFVDFEAIDGELLLTSDGVIPLVRYAIGDHGGVIEYDDMQRLLHRYDINLKAEIQKAGIGHTINKRPFVYVYERTDLSETLHGIIVYPEFVKEGLLNPMLSEQCTERFTMFTKHDIHHNQFLQVNVELQKDVEPTPEIEAQALDAIRESMIAKSSEFAEVSKSKASQKLIEIVLWPHGHSRYFGAGTKQMWVKKA